MKWHPELIQHLKNAGWDIVNHDDTHIEIGDGNVYTITSDNKIIKTTGLAIGSPSNDLINQLNTLGFLNEREFMDPYLFKYIHDNF